MNLMTIYTDSNKPSHCGSYVPPVSTVLSFSAEGILCQSFIGSPDSPSDGYGYVDMGEI